VHTIAFRKGRSSAEVTDPAVGIATNPSVVFSEGQLNSLAVGMFAALSLSVDVPVPFIMLDDPMQSVDGANVLGVADLCRELGVKRQLLVTTHDRRFAAVLTRKLAPREEHSKAIVLRLRGWRPQGPDVETYQLPVSVPPILGVA
jgi:predicted ATPase